MGVRVCVRACGCVRARVDGWVGRWQGLVARIEVMQIPQFLHCACRVEDIGCHMALSTAVLGSDDPTCNISGRADPSSILALHKPWAADRLFIPPPFCYWNRCRLDKSLRGNGASPSNSKHLDKSEPHAPSDLGPCRLRRGFLVDLGGNVQVPPVQDLLGMDAVCARFGVADGGLGIGAF